MPNSTLQAASEINLGLFALKMAGGLLILISLIVLGLYLLKRFGPKTGLRFMHQNKLQMIERLNIGNKKSVVVVRFLKRELVLGVTDNNINLLTETESTHEQSEQKNFFKLLDQSIASHNPRPSPADPDTDPGPGSR